MMMKLKIPRQRQKTSGTAGTSECDWRQPEREFAADLANQHLELSTPPPAPVLPAPLLPPPEYLQYEDITPVSPFPPPPDSPFPHL